MSTRNIDYVPLTEVPSDWMNKAVQESLFIHRATGASNTMAAGLDTASTGHFGRNIAFSLAQAATVGYVEIDTGIDWRDRHLRIHGFMDPTRDIRPSKTEDHLLPRALYRFQMSFYTGAGGATVIYTPAPLRFNVTNTGILKVDKDSGYAYVEIYTSCQIKERS